MKSIISHWSMAQQELKRCVTLCFLLKIQSFPIKSEIKITRNFTPGSKKSNFDRNSEITHKQELSPTIFIGIHYF